MKAKKNKKGGSRSEHYENEEEAGKHRVLESGERGLVTREMNRVY